MSQDKVNPKLAQIMAEVFHLNPQKISIDDNTDTIEEWDSLGHIQLILSVEETFKVKFSTDLIPKLVSVKVIQDALKSKRAI